MKEPADDACQQPRGTFVPQIDTALCEGKAVCAAVCPYDVFDIRKLTGPERRALSFVTRLKLVAHGGKQAFATRAHDCRACGHCVDSCPEDAITLIRAG
ncbi:MAG: 4Fe-4S dicluster domain-containing protein [Alphaproteobacteria bacterium]|jgi:4Fe-4S ferredoxin